MAAFVPSTSAVQSSDGLTISLTDNSDYIDNTEGYEKADFTTNSIILKDSAGNILQTSNFLTGTTVTYAQTKDTWLTTVRTLAGIANYTVTEKFGLKRITNDKLQTALASGCCVSKSKKDNLCIASGYIQGADYALPVGNAVLWQKFVDAANGYLNLVA